MKPFGYPIFYRAYLIQRWYGRRFTGGGRLVLLGLLVSAVVGVDTKGTLAYQIFALLFSTLLIAMAAGRFFRNRCTIKRILPRFSTAGAELTYRILIHNPTDRAQVGLTLFEDIDNPYPGPQEFMSTSEPGEEKRNLFDKTLGYYRWLWLLSRKKMVESGAIALPPLPSRTKTEVVIQCTPRRRGTLQFTGITLARPDPFGLYNTCRTIPHRQSLPVLPERYDVPPIALAGTRQYQSGGVALASSVGDSEEFISLRDYRQGDPIRKIHWKSWARTGRPVVKEYQDEYFVRHALILDTYTAYDHSDVLEAAVSVAASLACEVRTQESLLDLMFVGTEAHCFTAGRGLAHTDRMLEILSAVRACREKPFDCLTSLVIERASMLSGWIGIFLRWDEQRRRLIDHLKGMGLPGRVLIVTDKSPDFLDPASTFDDDQAAGMQWLETGKIQEGLMRI